MTSERFRPSWDDYFMAIARIVATRATCDRANVGAVLIKNKRIISTGYNGAPPGMPHCDDVGHLMEEGHCIRTLHAEENCIVQAAAIGGVSAEGSTLYTTHSPCYHCTKRLIVAGVKRVVAGTEYRISQDVLDALEQGGVKLDMYKPDPEWKIKLAEIFPASNDTNG